MSEPICTKGGGMETKAAHECVFAVYHPDGNIEIGGCGDNSGESCPVKTLVRIYSHNSDGHSNIGEKTIGGSVVFDRVPRSDLEFMFGRACVICKDIGKSKYSGLLEESQIVLRKAFKLRYPEKPK